MDSDVVSEDWEIMCIIPVLKEEMIEENFQITDRSVLPARYMVSFH